LKPFQAPPQRTINTPWEYLLMDAALAIDEESLSAKKAAVAPPPPPAHEDNTSHVAVGDYLMEMSSSDPKLKPAGSATDGPKK